MFERIHISNTHIIIIMTRRTFFRGTVLFFVHCSRVLINLGVKYVKLYYFFENITGHYVYINNTFYTDKHKLYNIQKQFEVKLLNLCDFS